MSSKAEALQALKARRQAYTQDAAGAPSAAAPSPQLAAAAGQNSSPQRTPQPTKEPDLPTREVEAFAWICNTCARECVPVRTESRCLCGHRLKEHGPASSSAPSNCKAARCTCKGFFFVVAEGAWVLRCRCKHKHVEHDPATRACAKAGCGCRAFDSPWVCNCDHPWADHTQVVTTKQVVSVRDMMGAMSLAPGGAGPGGEVGLEVGAGGPAREVNDYNGLRRGDFGAAGRP